MSHRTLSSTAFKMLLNVNMHLTGEMHTFQTNNPLGIVRVLRDIKNPANISISNPAGITTRDKSCLIGFKYEMCLLLYSIPWIPPFLIFNTWRKFELKSHIMTTVYIANGSEL